jgi:hypothetical protein
MRSTTVPSVQSLLFPSALALAHLAFAAAEIAALPAALNRLFSLAALALAQRIFRAFAKALMSLRRWAADMRRFFGAASALAALTFAQRAVTAMRAASERDIFLAPVGLSGAEDVPPPPPAIESIWLCNVSICSLIAMIWRSWVVVNSVMFMGYL